MDKEAARVRADRLALAGGAPVYRGSWPRWPSAPAAARDALIDVLDSGRWAISGAFAGRECWEKRFSRAYAAFHGVRYAVPTTNGTSAITIALEALGIGPGAEVLVPGLTWVACASAVAGIGAVPVLVDVDAEGLAMSLEKAEDAVTARTRALLLVHPYCTLADIDAFLAFTRRHDIALIEDCSQAHGAEWRGRKVGSFGRAGVFSLQQVKVLTCGEGGIAITDDSEIDDRMQQLRADGRRYVAAPVLGQLELEEIGSVQGRNYCLSEFHAALAMSQLAGLEAQNRLRSDNAEHVMRLLAGVEGVRFVPAPEGTTLRTYYQFLVRFDPRILGPYDPDAIVNALTAELGVFCERIDAPLNANRLYDPLKSPRTPADAALRSRLDPRGAHLPNAARAQHECIAFGHWALLGGAAHNQALAEAIARVARNIDQLRPAQA